MGVDLFDDAGVYKIGPDQALVQTLDFFPPLVDDPYTFGRIAAANSLSDVYAMGGAPVTAMNIVGYPDKDIPMAWLGDILRGGAERVSAAGAVTVGGHSVRDTEIKYGLSVTGIVHPDRVLTNAGAQAGDALVLTKPIGSGVLTSAAKAGRIDDAELKEAVDVMIDLNAGACDAMLEAGVHAATDITGFGLLGHAYEMADGSGVSITIDAAAVPLLQRTRELAGEGVLTRAHRATLEHLGGRLDATGVDETLVSVLADAQTSGGLLIAVANERCADLVAALRRRHTTASAIIGRVTGPASHALRVT